MHRLSGRQGRAQHSAALVTLLERREAGSGPNVGLILVDGSPEICMVNLEERIDGCPMMIGHRRQRLVHTEELQVTAS